MMLSVRLDPSSRHAVSNIHNLDKKALKGIRQGLYRVGLNLKNTADKGILRSSKSGVYYKYKGRKVRASASGEYPANRSGENRRGIDFTVKGKRRLYFGGRAPHSKWLVLKDPKHGGRDFLLKAINQTHQKNRRILITELDKAVKAR